MRSLRFVFVWMALSAVALPGAGLAATYEIDPAHSTVGFRIRHLVGRVNGSFTRFAGTVEFDPKAPAKSRVEAIIEAASITTANDRRDEHLRGADFFDVGKHPNLTFTSNKVTARGKDRYRVFGTLTMHGVSRPAILDVTSGGQGKDPWGNTRAGFTATTTVKRKEYGIVWNKTLDQGGTLLGDDVEITLEIEAVLKK